MAEEEGMAIPETILHLKNIMESHQIEEDLHQIADGAGRSRDHLQWIQVEVGMICEVDKIEDTRMEDHLWDEEADLDHQIEL